MKTKDKINYHIHLMLCSLIAIAENLVRLLSFGFIETGWEMSYLVWYAGRRHQEAVKKAKQAK